MLLPDNACFSRVQQWPGIELMYAKWVRYSFARHIHECFTVGINLVGHGVFDCRGKRQDAWPGRVNLIGPGEAHTGRALERTGWTYFDFYIDAQCMKTLTQEAGVASLPIFRSSTVDDAQLAHLFHRVFNAIVWAPTTRLEQDCLLLAAIRMLCTRHTDLTRIPQKQTGWERGAIKQIRDYLETNHSAEIPIARLAKIAGWSPYHLIRTFYQQVGLTPHAYQNAVRVCKAQNRLRGGEAIASVAAACGFYDQSHMNRVFRRLIGTTPARYLRGIAILSKTQPQ